MAENDIASILEILQSVQVLTARLRRVEDLQELGTIITAAQRIKARAVERRAWHSPSE